jgi:hypothetical protein
MKHLSLKVCIMLSLAQGAARRHQASQRRRLYIGSQSRSLYCAVCINRWSVVTGKVDEKATQLHAIASLKVLLDATKPHNGAASTSAANHVQSTLETQLAREAEPNGVALTGGIEALVSPEYTLQYMSFL